VRIKKLEKHIEHLSNKLENKEAKQEEENRKTKKEIADLIKTTIQQVLPENMIPNFNMMANQITV
jgi:molecular chaperone GrpE (heat shock protein)